METLAYALTYGIFAFILIFSPIILIANILKARGKGDAYKTKNREKL